MSQLFEIAFSPTHIILNLVFVNPWGLGVLNYHHWFIDTHLESVWEKKRLWVGQVPLSHFVSAARYEVTGLDCNFCHLIGSFPLSYTAPHSEIFEKIPSFFKVENDCLFYSSVKYQGFVIGPFLSSRLDLKRYVTMGTTQCPQYPILQ